MPRRAHDDARRNRTARARRRLIPLLYAAATFAAVARAQDAVREGTRDTPPRTRRRDVGAPHAQTALIDALRDDARRPDD